MTPIRVVPQWFLRWFLLAAVTAVVPGSLPYGNRNHCDRFPDRFPTAETTRPTTPWKDHPMNNPTQDQDSDLQRQIAAAAQAQATGAERSNVRAVEVARRDRYAEAIEQSPNGAWTVLTGHTRLAPSFADAVMVVADEEMAGLRAEVERLRDLGVAWVDSWRARCREIAEERDEFKEASEERALAAEAAEAKSAAVEALVPRWRTALEGARQRANTGDDFAAIADEERVRRECADALGAALASVGRTEPAPAAASKDYFWPDQLSAEQRRRDNQPCPTCGGVKDLRFEDQLAELRERGREKAALEAEIEGDYRATHSAGGYALGSLEYPNNREGRRALARTWKRRYRP